MIVLDPNVDIDVSDDKDQFTIRRRSMVTGLDEAWINIYPWMEDQLLELLLQRKAAREAKKGSST